MCVCEFKCVGLLHRDQAFYKPAESIVCDVQWWLLFWFQSSTVFATCGYLVRRDFAGPYDDDDNVLCNIYTTIVLRLYLYRSGCVHARCLCSAAYTASAMSRLTGAVRCNDKITTIDGDCTKTQNRVALMCPT